jgi:hypothetical protein
MKKVVISLLVIQMVFVAALACAECPEKAKLVGMWEWFDTTTMSLGDDVVATMTALEAGEKKLEDVLADVGTGITPGLATSMELLDSSEMNMFLTLADTIDYENEIDGYMLIDMKGTWSLECEKLTVKAASVEKFEVSIDHLTDEQKKLVEDKLAEIKAEMEADMEAIGEELRGEFGNPPVAQILYIGEKYALIKATTDWGDDYKIYMKK